MLKWIILKILMFAVVGMAQNSKQPLVLFDLGNTLIDTTQGFDNLTWMPEAQDYLYSLYENNMKTGMIINIPEKWGATHSEKIDTLKAFIEKGWKEEEVFDWGQFELILIPLKDTERKPKKDLFELALCYAQIKNYAPVYQGEDAVEIQVSQLVGLPAFQVGSLENGPFFLPVESISQYSMYFQNQREPEVDCSGN